MSDVTNPFGEAAHHDQGKGQLIDLKGHIEHDPDFLRMAVKAALEAALEAEMTEALGAEKGERTETVWATAPATISAR